MAKQNTKSSLKNKFNKQEISQKLDNVAHNVAKKGLYFVAKRKTQTFDVVDVKTKRPVFQEIPSGQVAYRIVSQLNKTEIKKCKSAVSDYTKTLNTYAHLLEKHFTDILYYRHTMETTTDMIKYDAVESRLDMSELYMQDVVDKVCRDIHLHA